LIEYALFNTQLSSKQQLFCPYLSLDLPISGLFSSIDVHNSENSNFHWLLTIKDYSNLPPKIINFNEEMSRTSSVDELFEFALRYIDQEYGTTMSHLFGHKGAKLDSLRLFINGKVELTPTTNYIKPSHNKDTTNVHSSSPKLPSSITQIRRKNIHLEDLLHPYMKTWGDFISVTLRGWCQKISFLGVEITVFGKEEEVVMWIQEELTEVEEKKEVMGEVKNRPFSSPITKGRGFGGVKVEEKVVEIDELFGQQERVYPDGMPFWYLSYPSMPPYRLVILNRYVKVNYAYKINSTPVTIPENSKIFGRLIGIFYHGNLSKENVFPILGEFGYITLQDDKWMNYEGTLVRPWEWKQIGQRALLLIFTKYNILS
jgi:hypothetical protein